MRKVLLLALFASAAAALIDLGYPNFKCDSDVMKKSKTVPESAHSVRFADIEYVGALGDSLTAGDGAGAHKDDLSGIHIQFRDILKKFNKDLFGYSIGTGSATNWEKAHLNAGIGGAKSAAMLEQAQQLVERIKAHPEIDYINKWKLIHIFIGGNDMCAYCKRPDQESADHYRDNIKAAIQYLKDTLPKTIVTLTGMLDLSILRAVDGANKDCHTIHLFECSCEGNDLFTDEEMHKASKEYMAAEQELQDTGIFDDKEDFTLVIQPFFEGLNHPPQNPDGKPNFDFFAADCFHFSQFGHAMVAKNLWNNMIEPVGSKNKLAEVNNQTMPLLCPDKTCPFFRTTKNSKDCAKYMTPPA